MGRAIPVGWALPSGQAVLHVQHKARCDYYCSLGDHQYLRVRVLGYNPSMAWKIATGILAAAGATFASLQTFLKFSERSDRHKQYGARFIEIRDRADTLLIQLANTADRKPVTLLVR